MSSAQRKPERWIAGADSVIPRPRQPDGPPLPAAPMGRLHAVDDVGLLAGRAVCAAPVTLLDPARWQWPDDADELRPLCWACLSLTHTTGGLPSVG